MITAGKQQGLNLSEVEAKLILECMDAHASALAINKDGQTKLYDLLADRAEGNEFNYTICNAVEFCIERIDELLAYKEDPYWSLLSRNKFILERILEKATEPQALCVETPLGTIIVKPCKGE